jgi:hypothetical protein
MKLFTSVFFALTILLVSSAAFATIYLVAADPATHSVGIAAISSGPVVTYTPHAMNGIKGTGFTGWSGGTWNVSPEMDKRVFEMMGDSKTPEEIEAFVDSQIHNKYSRYIFISTKGTMGHVFPPKGCAEKECGYEASSTNQFFVMGGGLKHDVVHNSVKTYEPIHQMNLPFQCKLLAGIQTIINVGGEVKEFNESGIAIDNPNEDKQEWFDSTDVPENQIVSVLRSKMAQAGINCPAMRQVEGLTPKLKGNRKSLDL